MSFHAQLTLDDLHPPFRWIWADEASRVAQSVTADDVAKMGWRQDNNAIYALVDTAPTWAQVGGGSTPALGDLTDVTLVGLVDGELIKYNSGTGEWENGTMALADLSDIDLTGVADGSILYYSGGTWYVMDGNVHLVSDSATATASTAVTLGHNTTGTPAAGFGTALDVEAEDDTAPNQPIGSIVFSWVDPTNGATYSRVALYTMADSAKVLRAVFEPPNIVPVVAGNARGAGAVELQASRYNAVQVASGDGSGILSGDSNTADSDYSLIVAGSGNTSNGAFASVMNGEQCTAIADYSTILAGVWAETASRAQIAFSGFYFAAPSDALITLAVPVGREVAHGDTNWYTLFTNGTTLSPAYVYVPDNVAITFTGKVIGTDSGLTKVQSYTFSGAASCPGGVLTIHASNITTIFETDSNFAVQIVSSGANELYIQVQDAGASGDTIRWVGEINWVQVGNP